MTKPNVPTPLKGEWGRRALLFSLGLMVLYIMLGMPEHGRATDCAAVAGKTPTQIPNIDCSSPPCTANDNNCSCPGGTCNANCGPVTTCVLLGSDPPLTDPKWDEDYAGFPNLASFVSGKCPPDESGGLICPTTSNSTAR